MKLSFFQLSTTLIFIGLVGCATDPKSGPPALTAPASATDARQESGPPPSTQNKTSALPQGEYAVLVESLPLGGIVVVNGIPVGKAPQRILLPGTQRGFFRDPVSLKVRFIAADAAHPSQTVEELLTPLDKIPARVRFTPNGATRLARQ